MKHPLPLLIWIDQLFHIFYRCLRPSPTLLIINGFSHFRKCFVSDFGPFTGKSKEDVILSFNCCLRTSNTILITNIFEGFRQCFVSQTIIGYYNKDMCSSRRANYCSIVTEKGCYIIILLCIGFLIYPLSFKSSIMASLSFMLASRRAICSFNN